jgi:hypothetical protein
MVRSSWPTLEGLSSILRGILIDDIDKIDEW